MFSFRRTGAESSDYIIQRYAVMPLSPTAGLIRYYDSDTIACFDIIIIIIIIIQHQQN